MKYSGGWEEDKVPMERRESLRVLPQKPRLHNWGREWYSATQKKLSAARKGRSDGKPCASCRTITWDLTVQADDDTDGA